MGERECATGWPIRQARRSAAVTLERGKRGGFQDAAFRVLVGAEYITPMNALEIYDGLTGRRARFLRVDELCRLAVQAGHLADPAADAGRPLKEKQHLELAQGAFLAQILADPA